MLRYLKSTAAAILMMASSAAYAQKKMPSIAYLDMQSAILQTEEGKAAKGKIEKEAEEKRNSLVSQQNELKKLDEELQAQSGILSEDAKATKQRDFQSKVQNFRTAQMSFEQEVRGKEMQETQKIYQKLIQVVNEVAKKRNVDLVFERGAGALLYASSAEDITKEVTEAYNKKYKASAKK